MRTNRLFALAMVTTLAGMVPWLTAVPLAVKLLGVTLTLASLLVAYLTGSVLVTQRGNGKSDCGACETCSCGSSRSTAST